MPVVRRPKGKRDSAPQVQHLSSLAPDSTTRRAAKAEIHAATGVAGAPPSQSPTIIIPARPHLRLHSRPEPERETEPPQQAEAALEPEPWRHPDELLFIHPSPLSPHPPSSDAAEEWTDPAILRLVRASAFTIPPRPASISRATSPFVIVRCPRALFSTINGSGGAEGETADLSEEDVALPRAYRMPLLWVQKFLWLSVALALPVAGDTEPEREEKERNWDEDKWDLVHVARLCRALVSSARNESSREGGIPKTWRHPPFDRALRRYWHRWLVSRDEFLRDFWKEFGEEEFADVERGGDVLKLGWPQWVLKGHKGFFLTKEEAANGISAEELLRGSGIEDALASVTQKQIAQVNVPAEVQNDVQMNTSATLASESRSTSSSSPKSASTSTTPTLVAPQQPESRQASGTPNNVPTPGTVQPAAAVVRGSVSLGALVSRIPLGGGRHRVPGQGARVAGTRVVSQSESQNITTATQTAVQMTAHRTNASAASSLPTPPAQPHPFLSEIAQTNGKVKTKSKSKSKSRKEKAALLPDFTSFRSPEEPQERELISVGGEGEEAPGNENGHAPDTEMDVGMRDVTPIADESSVPQNAIPDLQATELVCPPLRIQYQEKSEERQEMEEDLVKDSVDTRMQDTRDAQQQPHEEQEQRDVDTPIIEGNNSDLDDDEDMELLYPDESSPVQLRHPSVLSPLFSPKSPSRSISPESRSPSPTIPALSSARFPSEAPSGTNPVFTFTPPSTSVSSQLVVPSASAHTSSTSTPSQLQLQLSPRGAFASLEPVAAAADPNIKQQLNLLARLTQSWGELQAEVSALRAELRASGGGGGTTHAHLEERVRTLEKAYSTPASAFIPTFATPTPIEQHPRSASMPLQSDASVVGARGHPLQHLISGEEEEHTQMDVDVDVPTSTRYAAGAARKEELPPRSRKFGSAARMGGI